MTSLKHIAGAAVLGAALLFGDGPFSSPAQAGYVVTLQEVGSDVVATGSGPIDLAGLSVIGPGVTGIGMNPQDGDIVTGPTPGGTIDIYSGVTGPASFGSGDTTFPDSGSGDVVGLAADLNRLLVPIGYVSGDLSSSATFLGHTFATLGVNPGTYVWSWGTGPDQNFTLIIGAPVAVPEPASLALLGTALAGLLLARTRRNRSEV